MIRKISTLIWDWNGTLLNDRDICIKAINHLLFERKLPLLSEEKYLQVFSFPVRDYYKSIGFDFEKESFDVPAIQFIEHYKSYLNKVSLFPEVQKNLLHFKQSGINQFILSATEQNSLLESVEYLNISHYFKAIYGIKDHFAKSKIERGIELMKLEKLDKNRTLLIGDTLHDMEVAEMLGIRCILVAQGHQAENRLKINGNVVINNINELSNRVEFNSY